MSANKLVVNNVSRHFGGLVAVDNVSLTFEPGEIYCVIGPNGAGKSTLLNLICGSIPPSSGDIRFNNEIISRLPLHKIARLGIARKFQVPTVFSSLTVRENLIVAESKHQQRSISGLGTEDILALTNLHTVQNERADTLAHGLKQWLEIAMALVTRPKLLLLDEPAAGMTADETHKMAQLLVSLRGKLSIIAIEHNMRFIKELNSHTVVMHHGRIVASGAYSEIERNDMVRDIYLGRQ